MKHLLGTFLCLFSLYGVSSAWSAESAPGYSSVAPIFSARCIMCHSGPKAPLELRLDTYENVMKGSRDGPVVIPKEPQRSEMVKRIRGKSKPQMPLNGPPWLSKDETARIEAWIAAGSLK